MTNFSFYKFTAERKKEEPISVQEFSNYLTSRPIGYMSFMTCKDTNNYKTIIKDITGNIVDYKFCSANENIILFLYDYENDKVSKDFLAIHGAHIHNDSSSNISVVTYYDEDMYNEWDNILNPKLLGQPSKSSIQETREMVKFFQKQFDAWKLPAAIVLRKEGEEINWCKLDLPNSDTKLLYDRFKKIMETINRYCQQDWSVVCHYLDVPANVIKSEDFNVYNFIDELVQKEKSIRGRYRLDDLATELNISTKGFYNKRNDSTFTREECIYIGIRFGLTIPQLNKLLIACGETDLSFNGREKVIGSCLYNKLSVGETNDLLFKENYKTILFKK